MKNVLILEDDLIMQRAYKRFIGSAHNITIVGTVAEAVAALDLGKPELFISDMRLPDGSGTEAVAHCQQKYPGLAIIVISGTIDDAKDLAVSKKMEKPFGPEELLGAIEEVTR